MQPFFSDVEADCQLCRSPTAKFHATGTRPAVAAAVAHHLGRFHQDWRNSLPESVVAGIESFIGEFKVA